MKKNITYLFGAGASCGSLENPSLPLVKDIPKRIHDIANKISQPEFRSWRRISTSVSQTERKTARICLFRSSRQISVPNLSQGNEKFVIEEIVGNYGLSAAAKFGEPLLSFAWESIDNIEGRVSRSVFGTDILVVIGYSFPFFNREVDRAIIGKMTDLERVYFQDTNPSAPMQRFRSIRSDLSSHNYIGWNDVSQFLLPEEL